MVPCNWATTSREKPKSNILIQFRKSDRLAECIHSKYFISWLNFFHEIKIKHNSHRNGFNFFLTNKT